MRLKQDYRLFQRKGSPSWYCYVWQGSKRIHLSTGESVKWRAEEKAKKLAAHYRTGQAMPSGKRITLDAFASDFFRWGVCSWIEKQHARNRPFSKDVARSRRSHLDNHILPAFKHYYMDEITRGAVEKWLMGLDLANQTRNHVLFSFRIVLREAEAQGIIGSNPLEKLDPFAVNAKTTRARDTLSMEELRALFPEDREKLLAVWLLPKHAAAFMVLASTGLRSGELRALQWRHVLWTDHALHVEQSAKLDGTIGATKTGDTRIVLLPSRTETELSMWMTKSKHKGTDDLVFYGRSGTHPIAAHTLSNAMGPALERSKIAISGRNIVVHSLRHGYNTYLRRKVPADILRALTGHKTQKMTDVYDHPTLSDRTASLAPAREALDGIFAEPKAQGK